MVEHYFTELFFEGIIYGAGFAIGVGFILVFINAVASRSRKAKAFRASRLYQERGQCAKGFAEGLDGKGKSN